MIDCVPYFVTFGLVFALNYFAMKSKRKFTRIALMMAGFILLVLFVGLRYRVGTDYDAYLRMYDRIGSTSWNSIWASGTELLLTLVFKICSSFLSEPRLIFVILAILLFAPLYLANKQFGYKYLAYSILTFCIMFLPFGMNGMRQGIAMSFVLLSFTYLMKDRTRGAVISLIIAVLFHTTALIVLPYFILFLIRKRKKINTTFWSLVLTGALSIIVLFFLNSLFLNSGFSKYSYILGAVDLEKMNLFSVVLYLPLAAFTFFLYPRGKADETVQEHKDLMISGLVFQLIGSSAQYLSRFALYFLIFAIFLMPELLQHVSDKRIRVLAKIIYLIYLITYFIIQFAVMGTHEILPYQTWIFGGGV